MKKNGLTAVEFIFPAEPEAAVVAASVAAGVPRLSKCSCGCQQFVLANQMFADPVRGVPASRMYECMGCGEYRLG